MLGSASCQEGEGKRGGDGGSPHQPRWGGSARRGAPDAWGANRRRLPASGEVLIPNEGSTGEQQLGGTFAVALGSDLFLWMAQALEFPASSAAPEEVLADAGAHWKGSTLLIAAGEVSPAHVPTVGLGAVLLSS